MSGLETDIQWFIARDGKQHGPVSDLELRKLVEFGHLKATDLVWRQGFADWRTAVSVFPNVANPAPASPTAQHPAAAPAGPAAAASIPASTIPASAGPQPLTGTPEASPQPGAPSQHAAASQPASGHTPQQQPQPGQPHQGAAPVKTEAWRAPGDTRPDPSLATRPLGNPTVRTAGPFPAGGAAPQGAAAPRPATDGFKPSEMTIPQRDQPAAPSGGRRKALVAVGLLAMTGVGAWLASQYTDEILDQLAATIGPSATSTANLAQPSPATATKAAPPAPAAPKAAPVAAAPPPAAPAAPPAPTPDDIDRKLQSRGMWVAVKQQFPDWYQARVAEVTRLETAQKDQTEISRYLIDELVTLRRQNAQHALAASTARHKELAAAFLANLKQLSQESGDGCYDFISKGEASAAIVARLGDPAKSAEIEAQVMAIVSAIAEGRTQPATHTTPIRTDYDVLAGELGRLGWTQADMQLFADPKALAQAPRARVCSMLQDWFTAHLAIQDPSTQARLLFETLKPVISG